MLPCSSLGNESREGFFQLLLSGLEISPFYVHFYIVLVLLGKLSVDVLPTSCSSVIQVKEPPKSDSSQSVLEHLSKYFFNCTYPKTLNLEARLWNGKVLDTHSAQTEFGLLKSCDRCTPYVWYEWYIAHMNKLKKTKSHESILWICPPFCLKQIKSMLW